MTPHDANLRSTSRRSVPCATPDAGPLSIDELAHELNNITDGTGRLVRLALRAVEDGRAGDAQRLLQDAQGGFADLARTLRHAMRGAEHLPRGRILGTADRVRDVVERVLAREEPAAEVSGTTLAATVSGTAAQLPAGPLMTLLTNGIRNAIRACAAAPDEERRVEVTITRSSREELDIVIADTGCGLDGPIADEPEGHGIGLAVCRRLAQEHEGRLELTNVPYGHGALLHIAIPLRNLHDDA